MAFISIIIPTYNREHIIEKAIASVINQSSDNWELIIVDDGSRDGTEDVVKPYLIDTRIKYLCQENEGACAARNNGAKIANHDYLGFLDSDDYIGEDWVSDFTKKIEEDDSTQIVFCNCKHKNITSGEIVKEVFPKLTPFSNNRKVLFYGGCFVLKKELFFSVKGFDEISRTGFFEPLLMKLDNHYDFNEIKISYVEKFNSIVVEHESNIRANYKLKHEDLEQIFKKHFKYLLRKRYFNSISNYCRIIAFNLSMDKTKNNFLTVLKYSFLSLFFKPYIIKDYFRVSKYLINSLNK